MPITEFHSLRNLAFNFQILPGERHVFVHQVNVISDLWYVLRVYFHPGIIQKTEPMAGWRLGFQYRLGVAFPCSP